MSKIELLHGDCLCLMRKIDDGSVDMILVDPPYGTTQNKWDSVIPLDRMWAEYRRVLKRNGACVIFCAQPFTSVLITSNPNEFRYDLIWRKNKVTGFLNANRMPLRQHELILVFYGRLPTYNPQKTDGHPPVHAFTKHTSDGTNYGATQVGITGGGQTTRHPTSVLDFPVVNNDSVEKVHPTQKPVELLEWLIRTYTNEGETVLDNCMGSGSTGVACVNTRRNFIGIELDDGYFNVSTSRVNQAIEGIPEPTCNR